MLRRWVPPAVVTSFVVALGTGAPLAGDDEDTHGPVCEDLSLAPGMSPVNPGISDAPRTPCRSISNI